MPTGIYKHKPLTEETKLKMSLASKGKPKSAEHIRNMGLVRKGVKQSEEAKRIRGLSLRGIPRTKEWREKIGNAHRGKKLTEEHKKALSIGHIGIKHSLEARKRKSEMQKGSKSHFWKGGVSNKNKLIRHSLEYRLWRESVFKRDNWTCIWCGTRCGNGKKVTLQADHIKCFADYPELRFAIDNGRTLCIDCHKTTDTYLSNYGRRTKEHTD